MRGNADKIAENFKHFDYRWIVPAFILYVFHMFVCGWRWYMLLKVLKFKIKLWEAICLTFKAYFCSLVIPGGAIGGDLAKIGFISVRAPKGTKVEGVFTILIDRITGMLALFITAIVLTLMSIPLLMNVDMPELYKWLSDFMHIHTTQENRKIFQGRRNCRRFASLCLRTGGVRRYLSSPAIQKNIHNRQVNGLGSTPKPTAH